MTVLMIDIMIIKPEKRDEFHENWENFQEIMKKTGLIKSTKLMVDGFGGILIEPISAYKYYAITEYEKTADIEELHRTLGEESEEYHDFERKLFEQSVPNSGKCLLMTDEFVRHI